MGSRLCLFAGIGLLGLAASAGSAVQPRTNEDGTAIAGKDEGTPDQQFAMPIEGDTDWPSYNRQLDGNRFSELSEINTANAGKLTEVCRVRMGGAGPFNSGPVLVNGGLYYTTSRGTVAINPQNCDVIWKSLYSPEEGEVFVHNRGVAYADGMVIRGTGDARMVAYDARTGREIWREKIGNPEIGEYVSAAPIAWDGKVYIGLAGGDWGIQGRMLALDSKTGKTVWTFNLIPHPGEYGNDTWPGETWKKGGGGTWSSYALDPEKGELFIPVANPAPDLNPWVRKGDNLFTNSVLVLDAKTGKRLWHYQTRPNDNHDYGVTPPALLIRNAKGRPVVIQGSKDGYVYSIDRNSRKLLYRTPVTTILNHDADPTKEGLKACPGMTGGVEYNGPAYDPARRIATFGAVDWCSILFVEDPPKYEAGQIYMGGAFKQDGLGSGWITALNVDSGTVKWKHHAPAPVVASLTSTAGGVTFAGDMAGTLFIFQTEDGKLLHSIETGGAIAGGIITYRSGGRQYLAVPSGNISRSTWPQAAPGTPSVIIYAVGDDAAAAAADSQQKKNVAVSTDNATRKADTARGHATYAATCAGCHGAQGEGLVGPALKNMGGKYSEEAMIAFLLKPTAPMPPVYPGLLNKQELVDVAAYTRTIK